MNFTMIINKTLSRNLYETLFGSISEGGGGVGRAVGGEGQVGDQHFN